jgi:glycosyltransferase involved in cell wall biosynthesis
MPKHTHILMLLENNSYTSDSRVRKEAESLTRAGYRVTVICQGKERRFRRATINGVAVWSYPPPRDGDGLIGYVVEYGYSLAVAFLLSVYIYITNRFSVIHAHNPPDLYVLIALPFKLLGVRFVFDHHDLAPELYMYARFGQSGNRLVFRALQFFEALTCKLADQILTANESHKQVALRRSNVRPEKFAIVRNGPLLKTFVPTARPIQLQGKDRFIIGYVGMIGYQDGADNLIRMIGHLVYSLQRTDIHCVVLGKGAALESVIALAERLRVRVYISFIGWVEPDEVPDYMASFDVCISPEPSSAYNNYTTMIKIPEYMSFARPVVAFDLPESRCSAGEAALYASSRNDPLELARLVALLLDNPALRASMGRHGRERVEKYLSWEVQEQALLQAYQQLSD